MYMKHFLLFATITLLFCNNINAQSPDKQPCTPDHAKISAVDNNDYNKLLARWIDGLKLTDEELTTIYYGAALHPHFNPNIKYSAIENAYNSGDIAKTYELAENALKSDPTNLWLLFKTYASASASTNNKIKALAPKYQDRLLNICDVIFKSGLGVIDSSPFMITRSSDIQEFVVKYIQPTIVNGESRIGKMDAVKVTLPGINDEVILYFSQFK